MKGRPVNANDLRLLEALLAHPHLAKRLTERTHEVIQSAELRRFVGRMVEVLRDFSEDDATEKLYDVPVRPNGFIKPIIVRVLVDTPPEQRMSKAEAEAVIEAMA